MENKDLILISFINAVNKTDISLSLTVNVGGQVITGSLISYKRYLQETGEEFGIVGDEHGLGNVLQETFNRLAEEAEKIEDTPSNDPNFIHLKDVRIVGTPSINAKHWRGKISSVDGFIFGQ